MNLWTDIRDFLFPRLCLSCGKKLLQSEDGLCISCFSSLPYTHLGNTSGNEMEKCFWGRFPVVRASSLFYYAKGGDVAQILYAMKYHARKKLCCRMGEYMAGELCDSGFIFQFIFGIFFHGLNAFIIRSLPNISFLNSTD
jgi:predicted amidophosphoribosyltransferase